MRRRIPVLALLVLFAFASLGAAQSLGELAKKEKERREKLRAEGRKARVIDEAALAGAEAGAENEEGEEAGAPPAGTVAPGAGAETRGSEGSEQDEEDEAEGAPELRLDRPLEERLRTFEVLKRIYEEEVREIDAKIRENEARLAEIEQELSALGAGGLPVAPQPDLRQRYDGEFYQLMAEKDRLTKENEKLAATKAEKRRALEEKARRAGIPPGYLRF